MQLQDSKVLRDERSQGHRPESEASRVWIQCAGIYCSLLKSCCVIIIIIVGSIVVVMLMKMSRVFSLTGKPEAKRLRTVPAPQALVARHPSRTRLHLPGSLNPKPEYILQRKSTPDRIRSSPHANINGECAAAYHEQSWQQQCQHVSCRRHEYLRVDFSSPQNDS